MKYVEEEKKDITQLKKVVRREILTMRDSINSEEKEQYDKKIRETVIDMTEYQEAEVILAYVSYKSEVDTTKLIEQAFRDGKIVFVPKVAGHDMDFWKIMSLEDLSEGYMGIWEPANSVSFPDSIVANCKVMMWMPGAVFDRERHRIGYGGGFYDRYLNRLSEWQPFVQRQADAASFILTTAALAYSCQVLERIPHEKHDRKPDLIITEQGIWCQLD